MASGLGDAGVERLNGHAGHSSRGTAVQVPTDFETAAIGGEGEKKRSPLNRSVTTTAASRVGLALAVGTCGPGFIDIGV